MTHEGCRLTRALAAASLKCGRLHGQGWRSMLGQGRPERARMTPGDTSCRKLRCCQPAVGVKFASLYQLARAESAQACCHAH